MTKHTGSIATSLFARARRASATPCMMAGAEVTETRLRNGLRVLVGERRGDPVVASVLFYRVGARNETEREAGLSHFLEHMMFKGSKRFGKGEIDRMTARLGGVNNAFTGYDHTAYWFEFASDRWVQALEIEADRMTGLLLDPTEFEAERDVVLEELAMGLDDPWRVLSYQVDRALFQSHPYGRPIIGYADALRRLTPDDMREYHARFYHPANATLVLGGDVSRAKALREVRARFGGIAAGQAYDRADCFRPPLAEPAGPIRVEASWEDEAQRLIMAWPTVSVGTATDYALDLALVLLASGRLSRLQGRLVFDEGLASSVSASNDTRVESGAFWIFAECDLGVAAQDLERVIDEELLRLATEKPGAAELARAKAMLRSSEAFDGETVSDFSEELGEWAVDCDWRLAFDQGARHGRVTAEEVRAAVATYLTPARRVVGWSLPRRPAPAALPAKPKRKRKAKKRVARRAKGGGRT